MKKRKDEKCDSFEEEGEEKEEEDKIFFLVLFSLVIYSKQLANQAIKALWLKTALTLEMSATAEAAAAKFTATLLLTSFVLEEKKDVETTANPFRRGYSTHQKCSISQILSL